MITRRDVLSQAVDACMKELYSYAYPHIEWDDFLLENKIYNANKKEGPAPFEFYYLPKEIMKDICDSYIFAYQIDSQQELLNTISILKDYCENPIVDKHISEYTDENGDYYPGYRDYDHPDNLEIEIKKKLEESPIISVPPSNKEEYYTELSEKLQNKFFEFLDMAGNFYKWNADLNSFNMSIYLGASPNTSKEEVIENWKKYRNKDIEIDDEQIKKEYYGEDYDE